MESRAWGRSKQQRFGRSNQDKQKMFFPYTVRKPGSRENGLGHTQGRIYNNEHPVFPAHVTTAITSLQQPEAAGLWSPASIMSTQ